MLDLPIETGVRLIDTKQWSESTFMFLCLLGTLAPNPQPTAILDGNRNPNIFKVSHRATLLTWHLANHLLFPFSLSLNQSINKVGGHRF